MTGTLRKNTPLADLFAEIKQKNMEPMVCDLGSCSLGTQRSQLALHAPNHQRLIKSLPATPDLDWN